MQKYILGAFVLILIVYSCANPGYPTGGPKDETPPVIKKSVPVNGQMNYKKKEVMIEFDEIIKLNEVNQKLVVSPPLKERPKIESRAQKLFINFEEELQENTTYTLDFADAIEDNNEGNPIESFVFSFSTGEVVDSFAIMGNLWDSFDLSPIHGALILAHKNLNDTAFTHDVPVRLGKSDEEGHFAIRNLSPGEYRIYAIEDANRNYMFDQPGEAIAWFDTIVSPSMKYVAMPDTLENDSVVFKDELVHTPNDLKLFMFEEKSKQQYFISEERKDSNIVSFMFNLPVENFSVEPINTNYKDNWAIFEPSINNDTVKIWLTDSVLYKNDTLDMAFSYLGLDTLQNPIQIQDTLTLYYFAPPQKESKRKKKKGEPVAAKTLKMEKSSSNVDVYESFNFVMPTPVKQIDWSRVKLFEMVDTLMNEIEYKHYQDSIHIRRYSINTKTKWTPGGQYLLTVDSAAINDVYNLYCDSIGKQFSVKSLDSYGTMLINMINPGKNWLVQLWGKGDEPIAQKYVPESGKFGFQYINAGSYELKLIIDRNRNGKWDTGEYSTKQQPEQVYFYPGKIDLRENWEKQVEWDLRDFDIYDYVSKNRKAKKRE
ncbi:Ig-like domain-containing protein [Plebeiibacterium marinum]|uniref:Ig-like domain-containing protein n=1 Tax=Plebeiibacterium marinum TaxID=2992111 RepID=A0AAE3SI53_9BACT|nr:Ig-like domain-containing protein [Plebeiobacterium marinum]MCW3804039.1 Ig-like domain-containing protein [Plebeiobacterium marinum]